MRARLQDAFLDGHELKSLVIENPGWHGAFLIAPKSRADGRIPDLVSILLAGTKEQIAGARFAHPLPLIYTFASRKASLDQEPLPSCLSVRSNLTAVIVRRPMGFGRA